MPKRIALLATCGLASALMLIAISFKQPLPVALGQTAGILVVGSAGSSTDFVNGRTVMLSSGGQPAILLSIDEARLLSADLADAADIADNNP